MMKTRILGLIAAALALSAGVHSAHAQGGGIYTWANFAGQPGGQGNADGMGSAARFNYPDGVAVDSAGNVFVADMGNYTIRKVTAAGVVTTLAGSAGSSGSADGTGSAARFGFPQGMAMDSAGNLYVADDYENNTIRKVTAEGGGDDTGGQRGVFWQRGWHG